MRDWHKIAANYRPMVGDVLHPDECVVIRIRGVEWSVRPLQLPRGVMHTPVFGDKVSLMQTVDPLGNKPMQDRAQELVIFLASGVDGLEKILAACIYLGELLDQQYKLTTEDKSALLSFRGDSAPAWYGPAIRHANGLTPHESVEELMQSLIPDTPTSPATKSWWKFWEK